MQTPTAPSRLRLRRDVGLSVLSLIFALLFIVIYGVFLTSFGGEFLIVIKGLWILPVFLVLLLGNAIVALILSIRSLHQGVYCDLPRMDRWPAAGGPG